MKTKIKAVEITPKDARCGIGSCPAVFEQTNCIGLGCPSVFKNNDKTLIVIGSVVAVNTLPKNILKKIGKGEIAIEIPTNILPKL